MSDYLEKLERLTNLFERGALSKEEFEAEKKKLLASTAPAGTLAPVEEETVVGAARPRWLTLGAPIALFAAVVGGGLVYLSSSRSAGHGDGAASRSGSDDNSFEGAIKFTNMASCEPTEGFSDLLNQMAQAALEPEGSTGRLVKIAGHADDYDVEAVRAGNGDQKALLARIALDGQWQGLSLTELRIGRWDDGVTESLQLRFAGDPEQTASALKQLGFPILADGKASRVDGTFIALEKDGGAQFLTCMRGKTRPADEGDSPDGNEQAATDA